MLRILGRHSTVVGSLAVSIPSSVYNLNKHVRSSGVRYLVVCCKCHQLYSFNNCVDKLDTTGEQYSKHCPFVRFPNHPQERFRIACGQVLLKTVNVTSGRKFLIHLKFFHISHYHLR